MNQPIFFAYTRSFWLALIGVVTLLAGDAAALESFAYGISLFTDLSVETIISTVQRLIPAVLFIAALHQRSGAARPYSANVKDT